MDNYWKYQIEEKGISGIISNIIENKITYPDFFHIDKQKYRCIKSYELYGNPCFIEGEIYECTRPIMQSIAYADEEYKAKYARHLSVSEYPHQCAFQHDKFVLHFKHLSEERNDKIDTIITGIKVEEQMKKAQEILQTKVIPRNIEFQKRKNK